MSSTSLSPNSTPVDERLRGISPRDKTNPDLQKERDQASFDPMQLTLVLDEGPVMTQKRRYFEHLVLSDPVFANAPDYYYLSRPERYSEGLRKHTHAIRKMRDLGITEDMDKALYISAAFPQEAPSLFMHEMAFVPMFNIQASDEQKEKWLKMIENYQIIGNYAQTELGHGTFVRGLETKAEYDPKTQEFILNTPTLTATKWWVGTLGKTANHALLIAQLYTQGKHCGLHAFLVPIRDMETHQPLPGVTVGDIGPKFGFCEMDNGFLRLDNVRIPRQNMLMAHSQVEPDGTYMPAMNDKIMYLGMLALRAKIPLLSARLLARACTIAIRYSCVRRQSELEPGAPEPQVLDFQTQQHKVFPLLAQSYAFWFVAYAMMRLHNQGMEEVMEGNFSKLLELHALSSALKAYSTSRAATGVEICRLACGGHGYSQSSGLPKLFTFTVATVTAEGEATVLMLQNARYLMKCYKSAQDGETMDTYSSYMVQKNFDSPSFSGDLNLASLTNALAYRAKRVVSYAASHLERAKATGKSSSLAWNDTSVLLEKAAVAHVEYVLVKSFVDYLKEVQTSPAVKEALHKMCALYAVYTVIEGAGDLVVDNYLNESQLDSLKDHLTTLYAAIRPDAIAYVDGFDFTDYCLGSVLGRYDGQVYENLYEWARNYPMNKTDVHESYHKYLKKLITSKI